MTSSFFTEYLADAKNASAATGLLPSVILSQWAIETGNGTSVAFVHGNNYAGVSYSGVSSFPTKAAGLSAYISVLLQSNFASVRAAVGWSAQAVALGASNWAAEHYDYADWIAARSPQNPAAWTPPNPGIDLLGIIRDNNLTQYDGAAAQNIGTDAASATAALAALPPILPPPPGLSSDVMAGDFAINGTSLDLVVSGAVVTAQLDLAMAQASTFTLTLHDPDQVLLNSGIFSEKAIVTFGSTSLSFSLVSVGKQGSVLTVTFEAYVVAALRTATGPITTAGGQMTRTDFARYLVAQVVGAGFNCPPDAWLYAQDDGYDRPTTEQISRGTSDAPLEDSWTCLQRLAAEIDWVCFEQLGDVYFGPESYLAAQPPTMVPVIGLGGIIDIDGEYDSGDTSATLTITATADNWFGQIGETVSLTTMGPLNGIWLASEIERDDVSEPEITITIVQPQPNLPEPTSGGAAAAVGAGDNSSSAASQQTQGGSQAAAQALAYCVAQLGKPYVWGDDNPAVGFDCSGLVFAAYGSVGINITRSTFSQWDAGLAKVPAGIGNLRPGDLVYFMGSDGSAGQPGHVAIVSSVNKGTNDVIVIDAYETGDPIRYDHFGYVQPGGSTAFAGTYFGALRPAP